MTEKEKLKIFNRQGVDVCCIGCGVQLRGTDDFAEVEYIRTKRGTNLFVHKKCVQKVWRK